MIKRTRMTYFFSFSLLRHSIFRLGFFLSFFSYLFFSRLSTIQLSLLYYLYDLFFSCCFVHVIVLSSFFPIDICIFLLIFINKKLFPTSSTSFKFIARLGKSLV